MLKSLSAILLALASFSAVSQSTLVVSNLNDSGPGSLRQQVFNSSAGDTIQFDPALLANGSDTLHLRFTISLTHGLTIRGGNLQSDTIYICGDDSVQLFYIDMSNSPGNNFYFDNLTMIKAQSIQEGGALYCNQANSLTINNCVFRSNKSGTGYGGGAVMVRYGRFNVYNSTFDQNWSDREGGGAKCLFTNNATSFTNCSFTQNTAREGGGLTLYSCSAFVINSCNFTHNSTLSNYGGGVFAFYTGNGFINKSTFSNNHSLTKGGGLAFRFSDSAIYINDCYFHSNKADGYGGAVHAQSSILELKHSTFSNNEAAYGGGLDIYNDDEVLISTCTFEQNKAITQYNEIRGAGFNQFNIENSTFINSINQKFLFEKSGPNMTITNSVFHYRNSNLLGSSTSITSGGYNVFAGGVPFNISTDRENLSGIPQFFEPLASSQHMPPVLLPKDTTSYFLNAGNPNDFSDAQNGPIYGQRDIGAAERPVYAYDTTLACSTVNWWGGSYSSEGMYTDTVFNANSIDSVGFLVLELQDTSVMKSNGMLIALENDSNTTFQWVDCNNGYSPVSGATDSAFTPPANGSYAVVLTNGSCSDTSACITYNEFSLHEENRSNWLTFYPNPTSGTISFQTQGPTPSSLHVIDLSGRVVYSRELNGETTLQLPNLSNGTYILKWVGENGEVQLDKLAVSSEL